MRFPRREARPQGRASIATTGLVAQIRATAQVGLVRLVGADDLENVGLVAHVLGLRLDHQYRLHRLMVACTIIFRSLVEIVFERFQRRDDLVGVNAAGILDGGKDAANAAIAQRAVVGRQLAVIHLAEPVIERLRGGELVLKAPIKRAATDHALERLRTGRDAARMRQQRRDDLRGLLDAEIGRLLQRDLLIAPEIADAEHIGLERLDPRQQRREVGGAERVADIPEVLDAEGLAGLEEAANHFLAVGIVGGEKRDLLAELRKDVAAHGPRRHVRIQGLMERVFAEILGLVDGIGLADRVEDDAAFLGDIVDRKLHCGGKTADDEIDFLLLHQFQGACRRFAGIEFVVAHDQFRLATVEAAAVIELRDGQLRGAHLILRFGAVGSGQRNRKADLDVGFLCLQQIDTKRRGGKCRACADRGQEATARNRSGFGDALGHWCPPRIFALHSFIFDFTGVVLGQIRPSADRISCGVRGISVMTAPNGRNASFTAFDTAAAAPAVPASPAPLAPSSVSNVGETTCPTSISGISPDIGTR